jgi:HAE1 family hydrophobic/amphiphilic exporter-1
MSLIEVFVRNPVKVAVGVLLVALFGAIALMRMPMQLTPEVTIPIITVTTVWPGASPQEVEQEIVTEQEEQLTSVEGITKLSSSSSDSLGTITMEFQVGTDMEEALLKVNSRLQQVPEYPEDADEPVISTADSSSAGQAIAWFILSPKYATPEEIDAFAKRHPALTDELASARNAHNMGVRIMRLRELATKHAEIKELLPREGLDVTKMRRFVEDEIETRFERVPGVSQSTTFGGLEDELQVVVDPERLAARRLTLTDVRNVLRSQNEDVSAGDFWEGKRRWVVRAMGQFRSPEQVENQLLAIRNGAPVFVRDVAEVRLGYKKPSGFVRRYGESTIAVNATREVGANVLDVMAGLREAVRELNRDMLNPRGLQLTQAYDETEYIYSAVDLVKDNIFVGGALTMAVLMLFLHLEVRTLLVIPWIMITALLASWVSPWYFVVSATLIIGAGFWFARGALVVGLVIPVSIVGTFVFLEMMGRSLNVISLAGFAFAVGMFIDNAIVVLENIFRRHSLGESPLVATVRGTKEVWGAILAATLTNVAVFAPVIFMQEEAGQLFRDIALAVTGALLLSVVASMTIVPVATARLFRDSNPEEYKHESTPHLAVVDGNADGDVNGKGSVAGRAKAANNAAAPPTPPAPRSFTAHIIAPIIWIADRFVTAVVAINRWAQPSTARRLAVVCIMIGVSTGLTWLMWPKVEYLPTGNRNLVFGIVLPPPGYNVDKLMELAVTVEQGLEPYWNVDPNSPEAAELKYPIIDDFFVVAFNRQVFMGLRAHDPMRAKELEGLVFTIGNTRLEGAMAVARQSSIFGQGLEAGRTVDVEITGPDVSKLVGLGYQVIGQVGPLLTTTPEDPVQAMPQPSLDLSSPEVHIEPKLVQAADMRISTTDLGFTANALIDGAYVSDYFLEGKKIDLTVMGEEQYAGTTQDIEALPIATPMGQLVPLSAVASVELASGPEQINHRERERAITIQVTPPATVPLELAMQKIEQQIVQPIVAAGQLDGGYHINLAGTADKLRQAWVAMRFNILLAAIITYLLMAALFESWLYPFVIILTVPLGAVGGVLGLWLLNLYVLQTLDVLTMLGFVILIGTVVNNPILIVHQSLNHMREDGMSPSDAIVESVRTRIRPILMTAVTTVLGLLPLVLFPGAGSELYRGLGAVLLGGLIVSTLLPLVLIPALFSLTMDARAWIMQLVFGREQPVVVEAPPAKQPVGPPHVGEPLRESHERVRTASGLAAPKK